MKITDMVHVNWSPMERLLIDKWVVNRRAISPFWDCRFLTFQYKWFSCHHGFETNLCLLADRYFVPRRQVIIHTTVFRFNLRGKLLQSVPLLKCRSQVNISKLTSLFKWVRIKASVTDYCQRCSWHFSYAACFMPLIDSPRFGWWIVRFHLIIYHRHVWCVLNSPVFCRIWRIQFP